MQQKKNKEVQKNPNSFRQKNKPPVFVTRIKFDRSGKTFDYESNGFDLRVGENCIVDGEKGLEFGHVALAKRKIVPRRRKPLRKILRKATDDDINRMANNKKLENDAYDFCQEKIKEREISMKLMRVMFDFKAEKATFYFSSEGRVDFRDLVKELAHEFKTKIEMWQIGVREEARLTGGCGRCGRNLCCASFLHDFEPVSIRMAKDQDLTLNPMKISGVCGRLMCCLGYEHKNYCLLKKSLPRIGRTVETPEGTGRIIYVSMMMGKATLEIEDGKRIKVKISDIPKEVKKPRKENQKKIKEK